MLLLEYRVHHTNRRDGCCHRTQALELENRSRAPPKISSLGSTRRSPAQTTHQPPLALGQPKKPNCQKIVTVGTCRPYLPNVRCVGKQRIFHKKQDSLGIMQAQHLDQTLGCIPLTIVLHRTILQRRLARRQAQIPTLCRDGQSPLLRQHGGSSCSRLDTSSRCSRSNEPWSKKSVLPRQWK